MKKIIVYALLAAVVVTALAYPELTASTAVETATVVRRDIRAWVSDRARTSLPDTHRITMPLSGRVLPITIEEGDTVAADQVVAQLEDADLRSAVASAHAEIGVLDAQIAAQQKRAIEDLTLVEYTSVAEAVDRVIDAARQKVKASEARVDFAQWWLDSTRKAYETNSISAETFRQAQLEMAESDVGLSSDKMITDALIALRVAMNVYPGLVREWLDLKKQNERGLRRQREAAEIRLEQAERDLARAPITSPVDGIVLQRWISTSSYLAAGTALMEIGEPDRLEITVDVLSQDAQFIHPGLAAEISGLAAEPMPAVVARVKPAAFTQLSSLGVEQQRVGVILKFEDEGFAGHNIGVGYRARARIFTAIAHDALTVPRRALVRGPGQEWRVFREADGRAVMSVVEIGLVNDTHAEVVSGLTEGARVVLSPPASLADGSRISSRG